MQRLGTQAPEIPDHVRILQVCLRVSLLAVDKGWKLNGKRERGKKKVYRKYGVLYYIMPIARFMDYYDIMNNIILEF